VDDDVDSIGFGPWLCGQPGDHLFTDHRVARRCRRVHFLSYRRQSLDQVRPAYDSHQPSVAHDWDTFDAFIFEERGDIAQFRIGSGDDDVATHDIGHLARMRFYELAGQPLLSDQQSDPPGRRSVGMRFAPPQQITFGDNADQCPVVVDHGQTADPVCEQNFGNVLYRRLRTNGDDVRDHYVGGFHVGNSQSRPSLSASCHKPH